MLTESEIQSDSVDNKRQTLLLHYIKAKLNKLFPDVLLYNRCQDVGEIMLHTVALSFVQS